MYDMIVLPLCRVGNIRSAHVVPKRAEQTEEVLLRPLTPLPFPKRAHEKRILHPSAYGKMEKMQQAVNTMHMYYATSIELQHGRASIHLALLCCCCSLLLPLLLLPRPCLLSATRSSRIRFSSI